jgi:uncharacterized protein
MTLKKLKEIAPELAKKYSIRYLAVFGSYARKTENKKSDIDLLVKFSKPISFIDLIKTEQAIKKIMKRKVDLVTNNSMSPKIKKLIKKDIKVLYEK